MPDPLSARGPRPAGLPSGERITELLTPEFARLGVEIETVTIENGEEGDAAARVIVVVDADSPPDLQALTALNRAASVLLDEVDQGAEPYELEITTPGVDRPLTTPTHFRRAQGRLAQFRTAGEEEFTGRIGALSDDGVQVVMRKPVKGTGWNVRHLPFCDIERAVVEVEFGTPNRQELTLAGIDPVSDEQEAHHTESGGGA